MKRCDRPLRLVSIEGIKMVCKWATNRRERISVQYVLHWWKDGRCSVVVGFFIDSQTSPWSLFERDFVCIITHVRQRLDKLLLTVYEVNLGYIRVPTNESLGHLATPAVNGRDICEYCVGSHRFMPTTNVVGREWNEWPSNSFQTEWYWKGFSRLPPLKWTGTWVWVGRIVSQ